MAQTEANLQRVVEMRRSGQGWQEVLEATGVGHSDAERAVWMAEWAEAGLEHLTMSGRTIAALRGYWQDAEGTWVRLTTEDAWSWGRIACSGAPKADNALAPAVSEGQVKKLFREATDLSDHGQRNGHGGRFYAGDVALYDATLKASGTDLPKDVVRDALVRRELAQQQKMVKMPISELVELAKEMGLKPTKNWTPAKLVHEIAKRS